MNVADIKEHVRRAIDSEWPAFAASHPRLAAALDQAVLVESAMQSLADDAEYQEAMMTAQSIGAGGEIVAGLISRLVRQWLQRLI